MSKKYWNRKEDSHKQEVISKSYLNLVVRLLGRVLNYLVVFLIISIFGKEDFGKWVLLTTIFLITQLVSSIGVKIAIVKYFAEFETKQIDLKNLYKKALITITITSLIGIAVLIIISSLLAEIFEKDYISHYLKIIAIGILPINFIELHAGIYRGMRKIFQYSFFDSFLIPLSFILLLSINFLFSLDVIWLFYFYIASLTLVSIFSFVIIKITFTNIKSYLIGKKVISYKELVLVSLPMLPKPTPYS